MAAEELTQVEANDAVGISLTAGEEADAIVAVLREELGDQLRVTDCVTYLKLETDRGMLEVRFDDVAEMLGHRFGMSDFQMIFSSYYGRPLIGEDRIGVYSSMTVGVIDADE